MGHCQHQLKRSEKAGIAASVFVLLGLTAGDAAAQTPKLATVIPTLLGSGLSIAPGPGGAQASHFVPVDFSDPEVPRIGLVLNDAIIEQLPTFPIGSSSGGFTYRYDDNVGTFLRTTRSFGPTFGERAFTGGRKTLSAALTFQSVRFDRFDGALLDGDDMRVYFRHQGCCGFFSRGLTPENSDVLEATLRVRVESQTVAAMLTYGATDRMDLGITIPMVTTTLDATVDQRILRLGTAGTPTLHSFDGAGSTTRVTSGGGTASGVGDIGVRIKYNLLRRPGGGVAVGLDSRFPTGDAENLLGTGTIQSRVYGIVSGGSARFSPHANGGLTMATKQYQGTLTVGEPSDYIDYTAGFDFAVLDRLTATADVVGRITAYPESRSALRPRDLQYVTAVRGPIQTLTVEEFQTEFGIRNHREQGIFGIKLNPTRTALLSLNVMFPLSNYGLRNKPALNLGLEYTF
jgi:hypothetical protein